MIPKKYLSSRRDFIKTAGVAGTGALVVGTGYCADNKVFPMVQIIKAEEINKAWENVINKNARYRYVIDASTL